MKKLLQQMKSWTPEKYEAIRMAALAKLDRQIENSEKKMKRAEKRLNKKGLHIIAEGNLRYLCREFRPIVTVMQGEVK